MLKITFIMVGPYFYTGFLLALLYFKPFLMYHIYLYKDHISPVGAGDALTFNAILPAGNYTYFIRDRWGGVQSGPLVIAADAKTFTIPVGDLPENFINKHKGPFTLEVRDENDNIAPLRMLNDFQAVEFRVQQDEENKIHLGEVL